MKRFGVGTTAFFVLAAVCMAVGLPQQATVAVLAAIFLLLEDRLPPRRPS